MAKKENQSARTSLEEFNESLSSLEQKVEGNKKIIYYAGGAIVAIALLVIGYIYLIHNPNLEGAKEDISKADMACIRPLRLVALFPLLTSMRVSWSLMTLMLL